MLPTHAQERLNKHGLTDWDIVDLRYSAEGQLRLTFQAPSNIKTVITVSDASGTASHLT